MNERRNFPGVIIAGVVGGTSICMMALVFMGMATNVANSAAMAGMASAFATSQCVTGFMIIVALFAGSFAGASIARWQFSSSQHPTPKWLPGPNARWQRLDSSSCPQQLLQPPSIEASPMLLAGGTDEDDDLPLQNWGF